MIIFESERLLCRELQRQDLPLFFDLESNPRVLKYTGQEPVLDKVQCKKNLNSIIEKYNLPENTYNVWAVIRKSDDKFIGTAALILSENGNEIGYRLREVFWGNGYGLEIAENLVHYCLNELDLKGIYAEVDQANVISVRILNQTMIQKKSYWNERDQCNDYLYELSKEEYDEKRY